MLHQYKGQSQFTKRYLELTKLLVDTHKAITEKEAQKEKFDNIFCDAMEGLMDKSRRHDFVRLMESINEFPGNEAVSGLMQSLKPALQNAGTRMRGHMMEQQDYVDTALEVAESIKDVLVILGEQKARIESQIKQLREDTKRSTELKAELAKLKDASVGAEFGLEGVDSAVDIDKRTAEIEDELARLALRTEGDEPKAGSSRAAP